MAAYDARRPTADIDLAGQDVAAEVPLIERLVMHVAQQDVDDGVIFDTSHIASETIRDDDRYSGVRVRLQARIASAQFPFHVDVNVGDPIRPAPKQVHLPRLLGGHIVVHSYPLSMVIAEKVVTAVQRERANTRWRDYADIYLLTTRHELSGDEVQESLTTVATFRDVDLRRTADCLQGYANIGQARWARWRSKHTMDALIPNEFATVLTHMIHFSDPAIEQQVAGLTWHPKRRLWGQLGQEELSGADT